MNILITGASSGIGLATLKQLLPQHLILALSRTKPPIEDKNLTHIPFDLTKENDYQKLARSYPNVDTLILSAGIGHFGHLEQLNPKKMADLMQVNFFSQALLVKAFCPNLKKKPTAHIIIIGSEAALQGKKRSAIYSASKFAFRGFAQSLTEECRDTSVNVTLIQPGLTQTPFYENLSFTPNQQASLQPQDIAKTICWILSHPSRISCPELLLYPKKSNVMWKEKTEEKISPSVCGKTK